MVYKGMNPNSTDLAATASSQVLSELFCPPIQTWVLSDITLFKITAAATIIICPVSVLLNILVIFSVKRRRDLQRNNSNILLGSMAVAGVLVGAVSMPLTVVSDVLVLAKFHNAGVFCRIALVNDTVLYIGSCSSVYHLTLIAWERHVAIGEWANYKVIVTRGRVKKFARIAWLLAVLTPIPPSVMKIAGVEYKYLLFVDIACVLPGTLCLMLIGYFYVRVFLGVRNQETEKIRNFGCLVKTKFATKVAKTTAILTVVVLISFIPSLVFLLLGEMFAPLRRSSFFRWSAMLSQLNSVFNPVLYCYRDRRFRGAFLESLMIKKLAASDQSNNRPIEPAQSLGDLRRIELVPTSRSKTMATLVSNDIGGTGGQVRRQRCMSFPTPSNKVTISVDVHPPKITTTESGIQVETGATPKESQSHVQAISGQGQASVQVSFQTSLHSQVSRIQPAQGLRHHVREKIRSKSLDERLFVTAKTVSQYKC